VVATRVGDSSALMDLHRALVAEALAKAKKD
jgi:hypothetical protein